MEMNLARCGIERANWQQLFVLKSYSILVLGKKQRYFLFWKKKKKKDQQAGTTPFVAHSGWANFTAWPKHSIKSSCWDTHSDSVFLYFIRKLKCTTSEWIRSECVHISAQWNSSSFPGNTFSVFPTPFPYSPNRLHVSLLSPTVSSERERQREGEIQRRAG